MRSRLIVVNGRVAVSGIIGNDGTIYTGSGVPYAVCPKCVKRCWFSVLVVKVINCIRVYCGALSTVLGYGGFSCVALRSCWLQSWCIWVLVRLLWGGIAYYLTYCCRCLRCSWCWLGLVYFGMGAALYLFIAVGSYIFGFCTCWLWLLCFPASYGTCCLVPSPLIVCLL